MSNDLISRSALIKAVEDELNKGGIDGIVVFGMKKVLEYINNAPTASPKEICIANVHFDKEQLQEIIDKAIIRCKDCKHQKKYWHEDKRMKDKGYWIYGCELIDDHFTGTPVWGEDNQFCSSAVLRGR